MFKRVRIMITIHNIYNIQTLFSLVFMEMVEWVKITHYITLSLFSILEHFQYLDNEGSHIDTVGHTFLKPSKP